MRYGQGSQGAAWQGNGALARGDAWSPVLSDDPSPVIEELGTTPVGSVGRPVDRRLGLVVGLIAAIVGFGFMVRDVHVATPRAGDDDRASVRATSSPAVAPTDAQSTPTMLLPGSGTPAFGTTISIGTVADAAGASWLVVDAPAISTIGVLDIGARTASGVLVACGSAAATGTDERPASDGGPRVGVGSVHARILIAGRASTGPLSVTIRWRDGRVRVPGSAATSSACPVAAR
jgi:hypothetical protein